MIESADLSDTTRLLVAWSTGDEEALPRVMSRVYDELRRIAAGYLRDERQDHTLQTSALVNEAFLRLIDQRQVNWQNRAHFLGIAAQIMRRILIDHARHHAYVKRGGGLVRVALDEARYVAVQQPPEILELDSALNALAKLDPQQAKVVELRYFGGLNVQEIAAALEISVATVTRKWAIAKAWLYRYLHSSDDDRT